MFDFVVLGGGSAGHALALQLARDPAVQVALLEAGPAASARRPRPAWHFPTVAQAGLNGRSVALACGKGLGGAAAWGEGALPLRTPANLRVFTDALVARVLLRQARATGVEFHQAGTVQQLHAGRGVVLCAGALQSPAVLMRSGIGPHAHLVAEGVATRVSLPGVGLGLQVPVRVELPVRRGALASLGLRPLDGLALVLAQPASQGRVRLQGREPELPPQLDPELLGTREDMEALAQRLRVALARLAARGLQPGRPWRRGLSALALERLLRDLAMPAAGAIGGCRSGNGPLDVVDAGLAVHGVQGLHVADASVLATLSQRRAAVAALVAQLAQALLRSG